MTAPTQIKPCVNGGNIQYQFSNKGFQSARVEVIVYKIKKTNNLPAEQGPYLNRTAANLDANGVVINANDVVALPRLMHEAQCERAYLLNGRSEVGLDKLTGTGREASDITINPKVKF